MDNPMQQPTNPMQKEEWEEEKLPKMICDLIWSITDGGCKLKPNQMLSYQDEPVREFEDIKSFISTQISQAKSQERQRKDK